MLEVFKKRVSVRLVVWAVVAGAVACMVASLGWRSFQDAPVMLYQAQLMSLHGMMPYRDFFCINMPGALWFYIGVLKVFGTSDFALMLVNALVVVVIGWLTVLALPQEHRRSVGLFAAGLGVLRIFAGENYFILQRELLALVPMSAMVWLGLRRPWGRWWSEAGMGLAVAAMVLIKPQFLLFGFFVLLVVWQGWRCWRERVVALVVCGVAFVVPLVACGVWLWRGGAFAGVADTVTYWGLYGQMTQNFLFLEGAERVPLILKLVGEMVLSPYSGVVVLTVGLCCWQGVVERREVALLATLPLTALVILGIGGQFWGYHKLPFFFFSLVVAGRLLLVHGRARWLAVVVAVLWLPFAGYKVWRESCEPSIYRYKQGVAYDMSRYLEEHIEVGDRVHPLDWTYGALHAMLYNEALPATRFLEFSYFLHSVSHPLIKRFRVEVMEELRSTPPRFMLEALKQEYPRGVDTAESFAEFDVWHAENYVVVDEGEAYRIWELRRSFE